MVEETEAKWLPQSHTARKWQHTQPRDNVLSTAWITRTPTIRQEAFQRDMGAQRHSTSEQRQGKGSIWNGFMGSSPALEAQLRLKHRQRRGAQSVILQLEGGRICSQVMLGLLVHSPHSKIHSYQEYSKTPLFWKHNCIPFCLFSPRIRRHVFSCSFYSAVALKTLF